MTVFFSELLDRFRAARTARLIAGGGHEPNPTFWAAAGRDTIVAPLPRIRLALLEGPEAITHQRPPAIDALPARFFVRPA